jgi:hypothetical protein
LDRNQTPTKSSLVLSDSEFAKRSAPGRLTRAVTSADPSGAKGWTPIGSGSAAAVAGQVEHEARRAKPELVAKRQREGR